MKKKIVIRVSMNCDKCRTKALKIAVGICGVEEAALTGEAKDQLQVVGDGIDSVKLTRRLRKHMAYAELVSVGEVKKDHDKNPACYGYPHYNYCDCYVVEPMYHAPSCTIL